MPNPESLIAVLEEARALLDSEANEFAWSFWEDRADAVREIDAVIADVRGGILDELRLRMYFAPTGPIQEVSLSSGWGQVFVELADRFDAALADAVAGATCACRVRPLTGVAPSRELGMDADFGEVSILVCPACGQRWLRYYYVVEAFSRSGRWYLGAVSADDMAGLDAGNARETLERLPWYYYGGSYFDGAIGKTSGPILLG